MLHLLLILLINQSRAFTSSSSIPSNTCRWSTNAPNTRSTPDITVATDADTNNSTSTIIKPPNRRIPILSYKNNYVIVSKPAGVSMHRNSNHWGHAAKSPSLEKLVRRQLSRKPYLIHRLDHRTSGAVMMGFDPQTAGRLHGRLRDDGAIKLYIALVRGDLRKEFADAPPCVVGDRLQDILPNGKGTEEILQQSTGRRNYYGKITIDMPIKVDDVEKDATTDFYFLSCIDLNEKYSSNQSPDVPYSNKALTLLLCRPRTGRKHQIRRHLMKGLNCPIIGDSKHGDSRVNRFWRETIGLDRLALHCWCLSLPPDEQNDKNDDQGEYSLEDNESIQCIAPLPDDLTVALQHESLKVLWDEALEVEPLLGLEPFDEKGGTFGRHYRSNRTRPS